MPSVTLCASVRNHPKVRRLQRDLGPEGVLSLINLWCFCAEHRKDGKLHGMNSLDIALAADYDGKPEVFIQKLIELRLLEKEHRLLCVHDWMEYNKTRRRRTQAELGQTISSSDVQDVVAYYEKVNPSTTNRTIKPGSSEWKKIKKYLSEGFTSGDLILAIDGNLLCPWHGKIPGGHTIDLVLNGTGKVKRFIERAKDPEKYVEKPEEMIGHHKGSESFNDGDQARVF